MANVPTLSRQLGQPAYKVRRTQQRLQEHRLLRFTPIVNVSALGFTDYGVFLHRASESLKAEQIFLQELVKCEAVPWVSRCAGDYEYTFSLLGKHIGEIDAHLNKLVRRFGRQVIEQVITIRLCWTFFPPKYLAPAAGEVKFLTCGGLPNTFAADATDFAILRSLEKLGCGGIQALAAVVGLPRSTTEYRIRRLEGAGVIVGYAFGVDIHALGINEYRLLVFVSGDTEALQTKLFAFCLQHPHIVALVRCVGPWSYEIRLQTADAHVVASVSDEIVEHFGSAVREIKILSELHAPKRIPFPGKR